MDKDHELKQTFNYRLRSNTYSGDYALGSVRLYVCLFIVCLFVCLFTVFEKKEYYQSNILVRVCILGAFVDADVVNRLLISWILLDSCTLQMSCT